MAMLLVLAGAGNVVSDGWPGSPKGGGVYLYSPWEGYLSGPAGRLVWAGGLRLYPHFPPSQGPLSKPDISLNGCEDWILWPAFPFYWGFGLNHSSSLD